jgi:hypothetical protein
MPTAAMIRRALVFVLATAAFAPLAACTQGEGGVCQINDDCDDGLICVPGTGRCQKPGGSSVADAGPPDANTPDARPPDAGEPDAMP